MTEKDAVKCVAFADERCWYRAGHRRILRERSRASCVDLVLARASAFKARRVDDSNG
mgnify:CR=1 FL=1